MSDYELTKRDLQGIEDDWRYEINHVALHELGISIQLDQFGQVLVIKKNPEKKGRPSITLYKYVADDKIRRASEKAGRA